jgi:glycosyltransferase involved in cell wall biosynthesis
MSGMQKVLPQATIICLPSYREGIPKVLIEAAACGRPIVTTDVPGCRDVVQHYVNGMLVPPENVDVLALTIKVLLDNSDLRARMGDAGRKIAAHFSQDVVTEKTLARYGLLTSSRTVFQ